MDAADVMRLSFSATRFLMTSLRLSTPHTCHPEARSRLTMAAPIPEAEPVTTQDRALTSALFA